MKKSVRWIRGLTLIEVIGVLATVAILASLLVPRVFQAVEEQKRAVIRSTNSVIVNGTVVFTNDGSVYSEVYGVLWVTNRVLATNPTTGQYRLVTNVVPIVSRFTVGGGVGRTNISPVPKR